MRDLIGANVTLRANPAAPFEAHYEDLCAEDMAGADPSSAGKRAAVRCESLLPPWAFVLVKSATLVGLAVSTLGAMMFVACLGEPRLDSLRDWALRGAGCSAVASILLGQVLRIRARRLPSEEFWSSAIAQNLAVARFMYVGAGLWLVWYMAGMAGFIGSLVCFALAMLGGLGRVDLAGTILVYIGGWASLLPLLNIPPCYCENGHMLEKRFRSCPKCAVHSAELPR